MKIIKKTSLLAILLLVILIAGFSSASFQQTIDINALRTEIAATIYAEIYATMHAPTPEPMINNSPAGSPVAEPTRRPTTMSIVSSGIGSGVQKPTPVLYAHMAQLVKQDHNYMLLGKELSFDVTYTFKNVGLLDWTNEFYLRYYKGLVPTQGKVIFLPALPKGETCSVKLNYISPNETGIFNSYFELINNDGAVILDNIFVGIQVQ